MTKIVIYCATLRGLAQESLEEQERAVRDRLAQLGVDHQAAVVVAEHDRSSSLDAANLFAELRKTRQIGVLSAYSTRELLHEKHSNAATRAVADSGGRIITATGGDITEMIKLVEVPLVSKATRIRYTRFLRYPSFGYRAVTTRPDDVGADTTAALPSRVVPNDAEADVVRLIFQRFGVERRSMAAICRELNATGATRGRLGHTRWTQSSVRFVLRNPKYVGFWSGSESMNGLLAEFRVPASPLISEEVWRLAQSRIARRRRKHRDPQLFWANPAVQP